MSNLEISDLKLSDSNFVVLDAGELNSIRGGATQIFDDGSTLTTTGRCLDGTWVDVYTCTDIDGNPGSTLIDISGPNSCA